MAKLDGGVLMPILTMAGFLRHLFLLPLPDTANQIFFQQCFYSQKYDCVLLKCRDSRDIYEPGLLFDMILRESMSGVYPCLRGPAHVRWA